MKPWHSEHVSVHRTLQSRQRPEQSPGACTDQRRRENPNLRQWGEVFYPFAQCIVFASRQQLEGSLLLRVGGGVRRNSGFKLLVT